MTIRRLRRATERCLEAEKRKAKTKTWVVGTRERMEEEIGMARSVRSVRRAG